MLAQTAMNDTAMIDRPNAAAMGHVSRGLSVVSIAKSYDRKAVLLDVSLGVERGEVVGLLGPNGAGKTTCFYSIMGLVKPDSGRAVVDGGAGSTSGPAGTTSEQGGRVTGTFTVPQRNK